MADIPSYAGFDEDFVTVNPYLGSDGIKPFIDVCKEEKKGIFVQTDKVRAVSSPYQVQGINLLLN